MKSPIQYPPLLSAEEERTCVRAWFERSDTKARERLLTNVLRFITQHAVKLATASTPIEDLIQAGMLGAIRALEKFEPNRGLRFVTYAAPWIRQAMYRHVSANRCVVSGTTISMKKSEREHDKARMAVETEEFQDGNETPTAPDGRASKGAPPKASVILERTDDEDLDAATRETRFRELIEKADLDLKEEMVITLRWLSPWGELLPMDEVAHAMDYTRERCSQIEKNAMTKIREVALILYGDDEL